MLVTVEPSHCTCPSVAAEPFASCVQEQKQENSCMQKEMATIELVAQDNHERARRLMKELSQMQQEYLELKKQVCTPEPQLASPGHHVGSVYSCPQGTGRVHGC